MIAAIYAWKSTEQNGVAAEAKSVTRQMRAREVLSDCESALADFQASLPTPYWHKRWVALVASLRAVGHVLDKVDRKLGREFDGAISEAWDKAKPEIFKKFIEEERNNVLKAYDLGVSRTPR